MSFPFEFLEAPALFFGRHARAHNPHELVLMLGKNHDHNTRFDSAYGDETILFV